MRQSTIRLLFITCFLLCQSAGIALAGNFGIQAAFVHTSTSQQPTEVASNSLRVKNFTNSTVRFKVNFSLPGGWSFLGNSEKTVELAAGDSVFIPARLIMDKNSKGGTSYIVTAWLASDKGVQFSSQNWYVTVPIKSSWTAQLPSKQTYFITGVDSSGFRVLFKNQGNADEQLRISLVPDHRLEILRGSDGGAALLTFTLNLPVGTDTLLTFPVVKRSDKKNTGRKDADLHAPPSKEVYSIQLIAKSLNTAASWSGTMQFLKLGNIAHLNEFGHSAVPLVLEANIYDVLSNGTSMSLDAYGSINMRNDGILNYRFQTVFVSNFLEQNSFLGNNHYVGYFNNRMSLEVGEVNGWGRSLLTGRGIKGSYTVGKNTIGGMYTRGPGFFKPHTSEGMGFYHNFRTSKLSWSNYLSTQSNTQLHIFNTLVNTAVVYRISPRHQILIGGGMSNEKYNFDTAKTVVAGYGFDATYSGSFKKLSVSASVANGSSNYALSRGVLMTSGRINYSLTNRRELSLSAQNFQQHPEYFAYGILMKGNYIRSDRYEVRYGIQSQGSSIALKPTYQYEENQTIRARAGGIGIEYNMRNLTGVRISTTGYAGYANAIDYQLPSFFIARMGVFARWEKMFFSLRYNYGPNQLTEQARFVKDNINPQSFHAVGSYDMWMANGKMLLTTTGNVLYESYFQKFNFRIRPELYYYAKSGMRLSLYASYMTSSQGANPLLEDRPGQENFETITNAEFSMGFGVRKQLGIPIPGKKFITARVVVYKDLNGNHKMDKNEEGVSDMLVNIKAKKILDDAADTTGINRTHGEDFISNEKGEILYENIPAGSYHIGCTSLVSQGEWFDSNGGDYLLDKKQTIYIALTKGVRLTGTLMVERDKYSDQEGVLDLSRIRITAIDSSGKAYSALTDRNGAFLMYVPTGIYTISINESALGSNYQFAQSKVNVDLSYFTENFSLTFNAVEKKRKMTIKKFNVQGEEQK